MTRWKESDLLKIQDKIKKSKPSLIIGIDVGTITGFAVWDRRVQKFVTLESLKIHVAMYRIQRWCEINRSLILVVVEDARQVRYKTDPEKAKGAGSVCRDSAIWEDFLSDMGVQFEMVRPNPRLTKYTSELFNQVTGYEGRTSSHARDAGMLVYGY